MSLRKCGECGHAQRADMSIRRVLPNMRYCPISGEYVRVDETQCASFAEDGQNVQERPGTAHARKKDYTDEGGLSR